VHTEQHDLARSFPDGIFDLVSALYLHSPARLPRGEVLRVAAARVRQGGVLAIVDHASVPPWSWADPDTTPPTPGETLEEIGLDLEPWDVLRLDAATREATGPNGQRAEVTDNIIMLRRR
jgi:hypothetical protein